ncbi:MAG: DUF6744 family protein [Oscillochloridaceae bacterium umkhey_bin13]
MMMTPRSVYEHNLPLIGYTIWWGLKGLRVQRSDLLAMLEQTGFAAFAPEPPTLALALKRAIHDWVKTRGVYSINEEEEEDEPQPGRTRRAVRDLVRPINTRSSTHVVFALVGENVDLAQLGLSYGTQARILLEKRSPRERQQHPPTLICTTEAVGIIAAQNEAQRLTQELRPRWQHYQECYISGDLSRMVRTIIDAIPGRVCVRREGGVYLVPADQHATLKRLQRLVEGLPTDGQHTPYLDMVGVPDEQATRRSMARAIQRGLLGELRAMHNELDDLRRKARTVQPETIAARLAAYQAVRNRASIYADLLGMQQRTIAEAIAELQGKARALLFSDEMPDSHHVAQASSLMPIVNPTTQI